MDPTETLNLIREAITKHDTEAAVDHFRDLDNWLSKGGLWPDQWAENT